jgi:hypothetical protein
VAGRRAAAGIAMVDGRRGRKFDTYFTSDGKKVYRFASPGGSRTAPGRAPRP